MPLHSLEIERHVIGGLIRNQEAIAEIEGFVKSNDFVAQPHSTIYSVLVSSYLAKETIDNVLLANKIKNLGISFKDNIQIGDYIEAISFAPISKEATIRACKELKKYRVLRDMDATLGKMKDKINNCGNDDLMTTISTVDALYGHRMNAFDQEEEPKPLFEGFYDEVEERGNNPFEEVGLATPYPEFNRLYGGLRNKNLYIVAARAKAGKALEENTLIPTPKGFSKIKDLKVGDEVFSLDGSITKISNTANWYNRKLYKASTCDKQFVICDEEHEWSLRKRVDYDFETISTKELFEYNEKQKSSKRPQTPSLPQSGALILEEKELPLDPYILGIWLADGTSENTTITTSDKYILEKLKYFSEKNGLILKNPIKYKYTITNNWKGNSFLKVLQSLDLINNKHIPEIYLRASISQRKELLNGLIDGDGSSSKRNGRIEFCNKNPLIAKKVLELVHSLGIKASLRKNKASLYGKDCGIRYRICFFYENGGLMPRKANNIAKRKKKFSNRHIKAEFFGIGNTVCIEVEHPSHIFLCGEAMIPTHNSTFLAEMGCEMSVIHDIPVLILDTEMSRDEVKYRSGAAKSDIPLWYLKTGNWRKNNDYVNKVRSGATKGLSGKYKNVYHMAVGNKSIEEVASICRRWYLRIVGRGNKCLIIYDYVKMVGNDERQRKEYQEMGDKIDFMKKLSEELDCPILTACQNNREGVVGGRDASEIVDDERSIGISDRVTHFASGVWIFRRRTPEEVALDTEESGTHKLIEVVCREQGREAAGHQDSIRRTFPNGKTLYVKNFINFNIQNFKVEERGSLVDCITRQNAQHLVIDGAGSADERPL